MGDVGLANPVMTASGTSGHGAELEAYGRLRELGAVTVKSLSAEPWAGNPAPRLHEAGDAMLNSVGLQGPGVETWLREDLPALEQAGAITVVSIWGRTAADYEKAAVLLRDAPAAVVAIEVNLSCPNLDGGAHLFAHDAGDTRTAVEAVVAASDRPVWAKLTAHVTDVVAIAGAAHEAGASAVTVTNTMLAMAIDTTTRRYRLGSGRNGGGLSGPAVHAIAVRAVHDIHRARPSLPIVGVGGVRTGLDAAELLLAGASAVQVGTATFADPRTPWRVRAELEQWCVDQGVTDIGAIIGGVHD